MKIRITTTLVFLAAMTQASSAVILQESFTDGSYTNQNLSGSAEWYVRNNASNVSVTVGALQIANVDTSDDGVLGYFTNSGATSVAVGETITLSFDMTLSSGTLSDIANRIRFGLMDSGGSRETADGSGFNAATYDGYRGYWGRLGLTGVGTSHIAARDSNNNNLLTTGASTTLGSDVDLADLSASTTYSVSLSIEHTNASTNTITLGIDGLDSFTRTDTSNLFSSFDTAVISIHGPGVATATLDNITVQAIPEPTTYALLSGLLAAGLILLRRRRQRSNI